MNDMSSFGAEAMWAAARHAVPGPGADSRIAFLRTAKLVHECHEQPCVLREISGDLLRVRLFGAVPFSYRRFELQFGDGECFMVELAWQSDGYAGLRFCDFKDSGALLSDRGPFRKRPIRIALSVPTMLSVRGEEFPVVIRDISHEGARIGDGPPLSLDEQVRLDIPGLENVVAKVRWRRDGMYGLVFVENFRFDEMAAAIGNLQSLSPDLSASA